MIIDLYMLQAYFAEPFSALYEHDLVRQYGRREVSAAIAKGLLEHRRIPCGKGRRRCVCRLSEKGIRHARKLLSAQ